MDLTADKPTATGEPDPERAETATKVAERTADEIKEAMLRRIESIQRRGDALKSEANFQGLTLKNQPAPEWMTSNPEQVALATAGVGAALALLTGLPGKLRRRREKKRRRDDQSDVLRYYMNAIVDDAARRRMDGDASTSAEGAMNDAIRASGPVIYAPPEPEAAGKGTFRQITRPRRQDRHRVCREGGDGRDDAEAHRRRRTLRGAQQRGRRHARAPGRRSDGVLGSCRRAPASPPPAALPAPLACRPARHRARSVALVSRVRSI